MKSDKLKAVWKEYTDNLAGNRHLNKEEIFVILNRSTKNEISKLAQNLIFEMIISVLLIGFLVYTAISRINDYYFLSLCILTIIVTIIVTIIYLKKYIQFNRLKHSNESLFSVLTKIIPACGSYRLTYRTLIIIIPYCVMLMIIIHVFFENKPLKVVLSESESLWGLCAGALVGITTAYFFGKWFIKKFYKVHLNRLKQNLKELEEND